MTWDTEDLVPGPVPLWFQISERLMTSLDKGEFAVGDALPSEAELGRRFGVSRTTARTALDSLESRGLTERKSGRGSIVLPPRVEQPLNLLSSFNEDMRARGLTPGYRDVRVDVAHAPADVAADLAVLQRAKLVRIRRLLLADGIPMGTSESWLAPTAADPEDELPDKLSIMSLYVWLERHRNLRVSAGHEIIEAGIANADQATALDIAVGDPVLVARRTARDPQGVPVEYSIRHYRADRYRYRIELTRL